MGFAITKKVTGTDKVDDYYLGLITQKEFREAIVKMEKYILLALTKHCDKKIDAYISEQSKRLKTRDKEINRHNRQVELHLRNQNKLVAELIKRGKK